MGSGHPAFSQTLWHRDHMPAVDFTVEELVAVTAAVRRTTNEGRYPLSPRLDPLKSALASSIPRQYLKHALNGRRCQREKGVAVMVVGRADDRQSLSHREGVAMGILLAFMPFIAFALVDRFVGPIEG